MLEKIESILMALRRRPLRTVLLLPCILAVFVAGAFLKGYFGKLGEDASLALTDARPADSKTRETAGAADPATPADQKEAPKRDQAQHTQDDPHETGHTKESSLSEPVQLQGEGGAAPDAGAVDVMPPSEPAEAPVLAASTRQERHKAMKSLSAQYDGRLARLNTVRDESGSLTSTDVVQRELEALLTNCYGIGLINEGLIEPSDLDEWTGINPVEVTLIIIRASVTRRGPTRTGLPSITEVAVAVRVESSDMRTHVRRFHDSETTAKHLSDAVKDEGDAALVEEAIVEVLKALRDDADIASLLRSDD